MENSEDSADNIIIVRGLIEDIYNEASLNNVSVTANFIGYVIKFNQN